MELILFIIEAVITMTIMKVLLGDRVKPIFIVKNKVKYEIIMAVCVISIGCIIIQVLNNTSYNYLGGIVFGAIQGIFEKVFVYKKEE